MLFVTTTSATAYGFVLPFAKYMREKGHDISCACSLKSFADAPSRVQEICDAGFVVHEIPFAREINAFQDIKAFVSLTRLLRDKNYDLVHTYTSKAGFIGRFAAELAGSPLVIHTILGLFYQNYDSGFKRNLFILLEKLTAPFCEGILCITEGMRQEAIHHQLKDEAENAFLIRLVGRYHPMKYHANFLQAAALLLQEYPDIPFALVGTGVVKENESLYQTIEQLGISPRTHLLGERSDMPRITAALDIASSASAYGEGCPLIVGEAMSCGVPCTVTDVGDSGLIVGNTGWVVPPKNPEALAKAWQESIDLGAEGREALGKAARTRVIECFSLDSVVASYERLYESAMTQR